MLTEAMGGRGRGGRGKADPEEDSGQGVVELGFSPSDT